MPKRKVEATDWQSNKQLKECTTYLLEKAPLSDVVFKVGDEGELIKAHKLILAMRSPVFEVMFYGSLPETNNPIVIPDIEPGAFKALLRYCYNDCEFIRQETVLSALYASKKYLMPTLEERCRQYLLNNLAVTNIWEVYTWSVVNADDKLLAACRAFFTRKVSVVRTTLFSEDFLRIPHKTLADLLQFNVSQTEASSGKAYGILIAEIELFNACNHWAESECARQGIELSGQNKRAALGHCLFCIRFQSMFIDYFLQTVVPTNMLVADEKNDIFERTCSATATKFATTNSNFLVRLNCTSQADTVDLKCSVLRNNAFKYSFLDLKPMESLVLSGIYIRQAISDKRNLAKMFVEVLIYRPNLEILCGKEVRPALGLKEGGSKHVLYLPIDRVRLQKNRSYTIQVEFSVNPPVGTYPLTDNGFSYQVKSKEDVNLKVVNSSKNRHIIGLNVCLS